MPSFHILVKSINRKDGRSSVAAAAYRAGVKLKNDKDGMLHDFSKKLGVINKFIIVPTDAPDWAHDREQLWNQVEASERRKDSRTAREFEIALPKEIGDEAREALTRQFVERLQRDFPGAYDVAIHKAGTANFHAHILASTRSLGPDGFGAKFRELDFAKTSGPIIDQIRADFADMQNAALERHQVHERVDHRSYARQDVDQVPTRHLGPVRTAIARRRALLDGLQRLARHRSVQHLLHRPLPKYMPQDQGRPSAGWGRVLLAAAAKAPAWVKPWAAPTPAPSPAPTPLPIMADLRSRIAKTEQPAATKPQMPARSPLLADLRSRIVEQKTAPQPVPRPPMPTIRPRPPVQAEPPRRSPAPEDDYSPGG